MGAIAQLCDDGVLADFLDRHTPFSIDRIRPSNPMGKDNLRAGGH
jgi:hypothetical protein